jgi:hypothetical protein
MALDIPPKKVVGKEVERNEYDAGCYEDS